jgi:hypothetical protein
MITATLKQEKEQNLISWGTPTNGDDVTLSDYRTMIRQAEQGNGISFEQYTKKNERMAAKTQIE